MCGFQISKKGMKNKMDGKSYVLENIIQNYRIKDGEKITSETLYQILENKRINIKEQKKRLGIKKNKLANNNTTNTKIYTNSIKIK